jgi:hypothetical protein
VMLADIAQADNPQANFAHGRSLTEGEGGASGN